MKAFWPASADTVFAFVTIDAIPGSTLKILQGIASTYYYTLGAISSSTYL